MGHIFKSKIFLVFVGLLILTVCSDSNKETNFSEQHQTLKVVLTDPVETLDPIKILYNSDWQVASMIYEGLVEYEHKTNTVNPLLAKSWQKLDEGKRWIFKLNSAKYFHDDPCFPQGKGRKINAFDILYNFNRIADPNETCYNSYLFFNKIKGMEEYNSGINDSISGIRVIDSTRIEFTLNKSYVTFLKILATPFAYVVPKEAIDFYGSQFYKNPVGTGKFRLTKWDGRNNIELVKSRNYESGMDHNNEFDIKFIKIKTLSDRSMMISDILKEECHIISINNETYNNLKMQEQLNSTCKLFVDSSTSTIRFFGFSMDVDNVVATNKYLRKLIATEFKHNFRNHIPIGFIHANSLLPGYYWNTQKAIRLGEKIKDSSFLTTQIINILTSSTMIDTKELQNTIKSLGLNANLTVQKLDYYRSIINDRPDIFRVSMSPSYPDPEEYYSLFYSKAGRSINLTGYCNNEYDSIYEKSLVEHNAEKRIALCEQLEEILLNDAPFIPISHSNYNYYIVNNDIDNFSLSFSIPCYKNMRIQY